MQLHNCRSIKYTLRVTRQIGEQSGYTTTVGCGYFLLHSYNSLRLWAEFFQSRIRKIFTLYEESSHHVQMRSIQPPEKSANCPYPARIMLTI